MPSVVDKHHQPADIPELEECRLIPTSARWTNIATAVQMKRLGKSVEEVAAHFEKTPSTIYRWWAEFEEVAAKLFAP